MTEMRRNLFTRRWVIVAPERERRPITARQQAEQRDVVGECPFCPGHEAETPPELWRLEDDCGTWQVRVVPNKYAVLNHSIRYDVDDEASGFFSIPGAGRHEVVIESPRHAADLSTMSVDAVRDVLVAYRKRYRALADEGWVYVVIFRNRGPGAGASLEHPHSQIVAAPIVPPDVRRRIDIATEHLHERGRSLHHDVLQWELRDGRRVVLEQERFVVIQPFASSAPYETWIMSRHGLPAFGGVGDDDLAAFATVLRATLSGLDQVLGAFEYNFVIESAPSGFDKCSRSSWQFRLVPRLTMPAGFELASGIEVNPVPPEAAAATLRPAVARALSQM